MHFFLSLRKFLPNHRTMTIRKKNKVVDSINWHKMPDISLWYTLNSFELCSSSTNPQCITNDNIIWIDPTHIHTLSFYCCWLIEDRCFQRVHSLNRMVRVHDNIVRSFITWAKALFKIDEHTVSAHKTLY